MKKNIYKILAASFALSLIMTSPVASITSHAAEDGLGFNGDFSEKGDSNNHGAMSDDYWGGGSSSSTGMGFNEDAEDNNDYGAMPDDYWSGGDNSSSSSSSSESAPAPEPAPAEPAQPAPAPAESTPAPAPSTGEPAPAPAPSTSESVQAPAESAPAVEAAPAPAESAPAEKAKDSSTAKTDSKKSGNKSDAKSEAKSKDNDNSKDSTVTVSSDEDGKLVHGKFTYVISSDRTLCEVYYDGKYMACLAVNDSKGSKATIESITLEQGKIGYCTLEITVGENTKTTKVTIVNEGSKGAYSLVKTIGVKTVTINGVKVPLAIKKVQTADIK